MNGLFKWDSGKEHNFNQVGIGVVASIHKLEIQNIVSDHVDSTDYVDFLSYTTANPSVNSSANYIGSDLVKIYSGSATITGAVVGLRTYAQINSGLANIIQGIDARAGWNSTDTTGGQSLYGVRSYIYNINTGKVSHAMAYKANSPVNNGGGTIEHNWGLYIADQAAITSAHDGAAIHIEGFGVLNGIGFSGANSDSENSRIYSDSAGYLSINVSAIGINTTARLGIFDICSGEIALAIGADSGANTRTNATAKWGRLGVAHYTNTEEPLGIFSGQSENGFNIIHIGGGSNSFNAATYLLFYTAANGTTLTGTERMRIDESGNIKIATLAGIGDRAVMAHNDGTLYCA
jgi:hypothetical protein